MIAFDECRKGPSAVTVWAPMPSSFETASYLRALNRALDYFRDGSFPWQWISIGSDSMSPDFKQELKKALSRDAECELCVPNRPKYFSSALSLSRYKTVVIFCPEQGYPIKECELLVRALEQGFDLAVGSRFLGSESIIHPSAKRFTVYRERLSSAWAGLVHRVCLSDPCSGFAAFRRAALEKVLNTNEAPPRDVIQIYSAAKRRRLRVKDVGVMWIPQERVSC